MLLIRIFNYFLFVFWVLIIVIYCSWVFVFLDNFIIYLFDNIVGKNVLK